MSDADSDEEGEAREGGKLGDQEELIRRDGDNTVDAAGGNCMGGAEGRGGGSRDRAAAASYRVNPVRIESCVSF